MKHQIIRWLKNLPWYLAEDFVCRPFSHKPATDLEFVPGLTICERCMAPLRFVNGEWTGNLAINDLKPSLSKDETQGANNQ